MGLVQYGQMAQRFFGLICTFSAGHDDDIDSDIILMEAYLHYTSQCQVVNLTPSNSRNALSTCILCVHCIFFTHIHGLQSNIHVFIADNKQKLTGC